MIKAAELACTMKCINLNVFAQIWIGFVLDEKYVCFRSISSNKPLMSTKRVLHLCFINLITQMAEQRDK